VLELGGFVGYSAIRLGSAVEVKIAVSQKSDGTTNISYARPLRMVSLEKDGGCVRLATALLSQVGLTTSAEVWSGRAADILPRVLEECGAGSVAFAFFDHSGSAFHHDLAILEHLGLLAPRAVIVADNVLKPGAPLFVWHVHTNAYDTTLISVREFVQTSVEDWVAVCTWRGGGANSAASLGALPLASPPLPGALSRLAWEADMMRRRSERSGVSVTDWATFARYVRQAFHRHGFEALPWQGQLC